jgi:hypothetical protein
MDAQLYLNLGSAAQDDKDDKGSDDKGSPANLSF